MFIRYSIAAPINFHNFWFVVSLEGLGHLDLGSYLFPLQVVADARGRRLVQDLIWGGLSGRFQDYVVRVALFPNCTFEAGDYRF